MAVSCDGCDKTPAVATVGRIVIDLPREFDDDAALRDGIRGAIERVLEDDETAEMVKNERNAAYVLHLTAGDVMRGGRDDEEGRPIELQLRPKRGVRDYEAVGRGLPLADVQASVITGFDDAWRVIEQERWLDASSNERLIKSIDHPDPRVRDFVLQRLGERKVVAAVEALCRRLQAEPRPELVLRAVGALVSIGDQRAVDPLIDLTRQKDPRFVVQVVYALSEIGGRTAQGYLVTLASGHPVEAVRESAAEALAELEARSAEPVAQQK